MDDAKTSLEKLVAQFNAIADFEQKCAFFHEHPELARIFHAVHFPKPNKPSATIK